MAAFSTFLRFLKWKMDGKREMENALASGYSYPIPVTSGLPVNREYSITAA